MPSKKKKYNARFPAGRIKKIMQSDEEIGKVAQAVPVIISRTLELFVESLLTKTLKITISRNAKTLSTSHMKQCIMSEHRFDFLRELVKNIPDISIVENEDETHSSQEDNYTDLETATDNNEPSTSRINFSLDVPTINYESGRLNLKREQKKIHSVEDYTAMDYPPAKLSRSESTPTPICISHTSMQNQEKHMRTFKNPQSSGISVPIVNFDFSKKTLKKESSLGSNNSTLPTIAAHDGISAEPIMNIDLTNFVSKLTEKTSNINSDSARAVRKSSTATIFENNVLDLQHNIKSATSTNVALNTNAHFQLDEDYDNI